MALLSSIAGTRRMNPSDQIGLEEIKRRVDAAVGETLAAGDPAAGWPSVRDMARLVQPQLDADVLLAVQREGLVRFVRRVMRMKNAQRNKAKQAKKKLARKSYYFLWYHKPAVSGQQSAISQKGVPAG